MEEGDLYKEKQEIILLKKELSEFYDKEDAKLIAQKQKVDAVLKKIEIAKKEIEDIKSENQKLKDEITRVVVNRAILTYDKMKVKVALDIFNNMIENGKINEVFDIMIRLKQKRVLTLLKKFDTPTKTYMMDKMKEYKYKEKNKKEENNG